jgi:hypothetical protein
MVKPVRLSVRAMGRAVRQGRGTCTAPAKRTVMARRRTRIAHQKAGGKAIAPRSRCASPFPAKTSPMSSAGASTG